MKPLSKPEFFRRFNEICNRRLMGGSVMTECPKCKGTAKLVAWLTLPRGGDFSEIDCPRCGPMYKIWGGRADG
ncbi:MAG: hypothetical protein HWN51_02240 [Desulfobacterales bacterium]|nr:hypothetical protein [Desulfobacterales bacterium]